MYNVFEKSPVHSLFAIYNTRCWQALVLLFCVVSTSGCFAEMFGPTEVQMFQYHARETQRVLELFTTRLYAKNPKYEPSKSARRKKIKKIFHGADDLGKYAGLTSDKVLEEAFAQEPDEPDRVYLLGLGLAKSIQETYSIKEQRILLSGLQISLERLKRLHHNISQMNWRLKTYEDKDGHLMFLTNETRDDGYMNMGYEVLITEILTMIKDDIYMRGGLPGKYIFNMTTLFASLII